MSMTFKTERIKKVLEKTNVDLIATINSLLDDPSMNDQDYIDDAITVHAFIVDRKIGMIDTSRKTRQGLHPLIYIPAYQSTIDFTKPINKNAICDDFETLVAMKFIQTKIGASERGITFNLTLAQLARIMKRKRCYYSGIEFNAHHSLTLDRKDASKGYEDGNVVPCSRIVNSLKEHFLENDHVSKTMTQKELVKTMKSFIEISELLEKEKQNDKETD